VVGVHEVHEAVVDGWALVGVQGGGEFGGLREGEGFVSENSEGSLDC
jgi:hypothetical protein